MLDELTCGFCSNSLEQLTISQREDHYETHFLAGGSTPINDVKCVAGPSRQGNNNMGEKIKNRFQPNMKEPWKRLVQKIENDMFWYPSLGVPPPRNFTPGLIPALKRSLAMLCADGKVAQAVLCHEKVVYINKELWDASWGCGYRNFLMLCTGLFEQDSQPLYFPLLDAPPAPSVRNLQAWIQHAWNNGYDEIGRKELRNKIIGTARWIGTAEIYIALSYRGIPAELVDFSDFKDKESCATSVLQWMVNYFTLGHPGGEKTPSSINDVLGKTTPIVVTRLMPVILQHRGHSRLIIGYERDLDGTINLLTFDTGRLLPQALRNLARSSYIAMGRSDDEQEGENASHTEPGKRERQQTKPLKRPIVLADLLTPSERELGRGFTPDSEEPQCDVGTSTKSEIMPRLKKGNALPISVSIKERKTRPDCQQVFKAFKLTHKQLALKNQYQVLYVPLRPPLTEAERRSRKIPTGQRITQTHQAAT